MTKWSESEQGEIDEIGSYVFSSGDVGVYIVSNRPLWFYASGSYRDLGCNPAQSETPWGESHSAF